MHEGTITTVLLPHCEKVRDEYAKGGAVSVRESSSVEMTECSFVGNSAVALVASSAGKYNDRIELL